MGWFSFGAKHKQPSSDMAVSGQTGHQAAITTVKVLGSGCAKCNQLEQAVREAMQELGMDAAIEHVTELEKIAAYGVMQTPALVVGEKVVCSGRVLKKDAVIELFKQVNADAE